MTILMVLDAALIAVVIKHEPLRGCDPSLNVNNTACSHTHTHTVAIQKIMNSSFY